MLTHFLQYFIVISRENPWFSNVSKWYRNGILAWSALKCTELSSYNAFCHSYHDCIVARGMYTWILGDSEITARP